MSCYAKHNIVIAKPKENLVKSRFNKIDAQRPTLNEHPAPPFNVGRKNGGIF